jgi:N4-(beta-N-acetylglucosaminyl)-L-asparaginase
MPDPLNRRDFLTLSAAAGVVLPAAMGGTPLQAPGRRKPVAVASANGLKAVETAVKLMLEGADPTDAAVAGVAIVEADPNDRTVGYGGLPNAEGVVELDAAVMHGPTHSAGAVASLRNIKHPAAVARLVMKRTDHCLLVGEGALRFAKMHGFPEEELLTEESRKIWAYWKETASALDDYLPPPPEEVDPVVRKHFGDEYVRTYGTIHLSALDTHGNLGCCTTTSGLAFKIPGRVGDSPILGAGLWLDNSVGSAGSTGRGEANLLNLSSHTMVEELRRGKSPTDAALEACRRVAATNLVPRLRDAQGRPNFDLKFYCLSRDGRFGGASLWAGGKFAVHDGEAARLVDAAALYDEPAPKGA